MRAQVLDARRPADVVETIDALGVVNIEPTAAVMPSADHILWSRIGWPYQPADLRRAEEVDRVVFEWRGFYRLMDDLALLLPEMRAGSPYQGVRDWLTANPRFRIDVLTRLRDCGPLHAAEVPDTAQVTWRSSGWTNNRNAQQMLELLVRQGEAAVWGRDRGGRLFDLAERVYPSEVPEFAPEDAVRLRATRRLQSLGIARARGPAQPVEQIAVGEVGEAAVIEGVPGRWQVDVTRLDDEFVPRVALLSPFDRLVFDRDRLRDLFGYEYLLEMYKPAAQRRWGYFALPILVGDRFVGKLDAKADRKAGVLRVGAIHEDEPLDSYTAEAVESAIGELGDWLGLDVLDAAQRG